ncbi:type II toxin-antitoxin system HicB family antitoxin [Paenibacillus amylolyticus]|uniref:Type II toxin-antitoxin system HicB family antitoxin n=1 Tax=Paenibacillus amylolyticus TaxID=1451 RepID=A0A5M9X237_PAEAM|nr:type II toxin-antitoxin system HicB family antitoxin [Paenibacillus amylolyticus]KAA8787859.1 type II toxin-antitoxin system HicB family antitoxin [Paenibacillus amylolyticus]
MRNFTVLIESDYAEHNFTGYVPELRLSTTGDTKEEVTQNLQDLIELEMERNPDLITHEYEVRTLTLGKEVR